MFSDDFSILEEVSENQNHTSLAYGADWCWVTPRALPHATPSDTSNKRPTTGAKSAEDSTKVPNAVGQNSDVETVGDGIDETPLLAETTYTETDNLLLASCSFYDHTMQIWLK